MGVCMSACMLMVYGFTGCADFLVLLDCVIQNGATRTHTEHMQNLKTA